MLCVWAEACVALWLGLCESVRLVLGGMDSFCSEAGRALNELFVSRFILTGNGCPFSAPMGNM